MPGSAMAARVMTASADGVAAGATSLTCTTPSASGPASAAAASRPSSPTGRQNIRATAPLGRSTVTAPGGRHRPRAAAATASADRVSVACEISAAWSAGDRARRAWSLSMTTSLPRASTMPPVCRQARVYSCSSRRSRPLLVSVQRLAELVGGGLDQRQHQRVGVPAPAGQVDHADGLAGHRVAQRHPGAGHALKPLRVVLVPEHVRGAARFQRGPDAVGADDFLGVGEAGHQHDRVELPFQVAVAGEAAQHEPGRVGQDDADRLPVELLVQVPQDRLGGARQRRVEVGRRPGSSGRAGWPRRSTPVTATRRPGSAP